MAVPVAVREVNVTPGFVHDAADGGAAPADNVGVVGETHVDFQGHSTAISNY